MTNARLTFLGTGEAFDARYNNTSVYIRTSSKNYLVDCGPTIPHQLWRMNADPNLLDVVYLTHFHADHAFGLASLLVRMKEDGRSKPLPILGQAGIKTFVERLVNFAYAGAYKTLGFLVQPIEISPKKELRLGTHTLSFHPTRHVVSNLAFRLAFGDFSLFVSGDGEWTEDSEAAFGASKYAIQECYTAEGSRQFHNSFERIRARVEDADDKPRPERSYLVHVARDQRERLEETVNATTLPLVIPRDMQTYDLN